MQLVVLGAHRSGTSALTRLVNMMGAYTGSEGTSIGANDENPKGFWERRDIVRLNDAILEHANCRWDSLYHWPCLTTQDTLDLPEDLIHQAKNIVLELDAHRPWVIKDPRLCQTFGLWRQWMELPAAIIMWRDPAEVAISLQKRNDIPLLQGLALWEHAMIGALNHSSGLPRIILSHQQLMQEPVKQVDRLLAWAEANNIGSLHRPSDQEITTFIDPSLYRSKSTDPSISELISPAQKELIAHLHAAQPDDTTPFTLSRASHDILQLAEQNRQQSALHERLFGQTQQQDETITQLQHRIEQYESENQARQAAPPTRPITPLEWDQLQQTIAQLQADLRETRRPLWPLRSLVSAITRAAMKS